MAQVAAKRRRLSELVGIAGISDSGLALIIENLQRDGIEEPVSRHDCHKAALDSIRSSDRKISLPLVKGGTWEWHYLLPQTIVKESVEGNRAVAEAYREVLARRPNSMESPWHMIWYFDELTPGNVIRPDNKRKTMSVYVSFAELGPELLCKCEFWFTIAVARTVMIRQVEGGWSRMLRDLVRAAFIGPETFESGVLIYLGLPRLFFARMSNVIADEAALKEAYDSKGASGLRCCPGCKNVMLRGSDVASRDASGYLVEFTCSDLDKLDWASDEDMFGAIDLLLASKGTMGVGAFDRLEKSSGFNHNPHGLFADLELRTHCRPASILTFDPMHCLWSNGVVGVEVHCLLSKMRENTKLGWRDLQMFCKADWSFPAFCSGKGRAIHDVWNESREKASKEHFKAGATELIIVLPLVMHFAELFLAAVLPHEVNCLRALMTVVHESQEAKFGRGCDRALASAVSRHMTLFRTVYGNDNMKPKHHYCCHLPRQLARDHFLLDAFTLERKHQEVKRAASNTDNTIEFELSTLARVRVAEMRSQSQLECTNGLRGPQARVDSVAAFIADSLEFNGLRLSAGDFVFRSNDILRVVGALLLDEHGLQLLVRICTFVRRMSAIAAVWTLDVGLARCSPEGVRPAACWCADGEGFLVLGM